MHQVLFVALGIVVGVLASFSGLGGGFLVVPLLIMLGYSAQKAVATSFLTILVISISALIAHNKLTGVDYKLGLFLGLGGVVGAQVGARLLQHVPTAAFNKIFAVILILLAAKMFFSKG